MRNEACVFFSTTFFFPQTTIIKQQINYETAFKSIEMHLRNKHNPCKEIKNDWKHKGDFLINEALR